MHLDLYKQKNTKKHTKYNGKRQKLRKPSKVMYSLFNGTSIKNSQRAIAKESEASHHLQTFQKIKYSYVEWWLSLGMHIHFANVHLSYWLWVPFRVPLKSKTCCIYIGILNRKSAGTCTEHTHTFKLSRPDQYCITFSHRYFAWFSLYTQALYKYFTKQQWQPGNGMNGEGTIRSQMVSLKCQQYCSKTPFPDHATNPKPVVISSCLVYLAIPA